MTRPLPLRGGQPADDAVVVIRAGVLRDEDTVRAAQRTMAVHGLYGLSVESAEGSTVLDGCRASRQLARYRHVRLSTFGRLRGAGFAVLATFDAPHHTVVLPDLSEVTLRRLARCFDDPIPNPAGSGNP